MSFEQQVAEGLMLRAVRHAADQAAYANFNAIYNNPFEGACGECLLRHHPTTTNDDYWFVEDQTTGHTVSTTCLLPWDSQFAGVDLRLAQLEMVLTHPDYRGRGLLRAQMKHFEQTAIKRGFDLCIISGIPYYYRQFGYSYTIEGSSAEVLPLWEIPDHPLDANLHVRLRKALSSDIPRLTQMYADAVSGLDFHIRRSADYWRYLLEFAQHPIEMIENAETGEILSYAIIDRFGGNVRISENSVSDVAVAYALLRLLKAQSKERVAVAFPEDNALVKVVRSLGSQTEAGGQWLIRIPDIPRFLTRIAPVLEMRLATSHWHRLTVDLTVNLYREAYHLRFDQGKLTQVAPLGFVDSSLGADGGDLCIPPDAFVRLVTGYRVLDELWDAWPDMVIKPEARHLIDVLFPRMKAFLSAPYHYLGPLEADQRR